MDFKAMPKIDLHLHLDCSLSYEVVRQIDPSVSLEVYQESFIGPPKCHDLADFLSRAINGINLMQTRQQLHLVTLDLFRQLMEDKVIYAEIRFAPLLHTEKGLKPVEVVQTVLEAAKEGMKKTGIKAGIILCTLRHFSESQSMETVQLVERFKGTAVVGFDIASDEAGFPIDNHLSAFAYARDKGLNITAHAGEAKGSESVWETLKHLRPQRIGHGVRSVEDPSLLKYLKNQNIHLEVCPTSNIQTNVVQSIKDHPVDVIYQSGVSMSINTDARTISDVTLNSEYRLLQDVFDWTKLHFKNCNLEAAKHAFLPEQDKVLLRDKIISAYRVD